MNEDKCSGLFTDAKDCPVHGRHDAGLPEEMRFPSGSSGKAYVSPSEIALRQRLRDLRDQWLEAAENEGDADYFFFANELTALLVDPLTHQEKPDA